MDYVLVAVVLMIGGFVVLVSGTAVTARTSRRATSESDEGNRTDLAVGLAVFGVVAMLFGAGLLVYSLLMR